MGEIKITGEDLENRVLDAEPEYRKEIQLELQKTEPEKTPFEEKPKNGFFKKLFNSQFLSGLGIYAGLMAVSTKLFTTTLHPYYINEMSPVAWFVTLVHNTIYASALAFLSSKLLGVFHKQDINPEYLSGTQHTLLKEQKSTAGKKDIQPITLISTIVGMVLGGGVFYLIEMDSTRFGGLNNQQIMFYTGGSFALGAMFTNMAYKVISAKNYLGSEIDKHRNEKIKKVYHSTKEAKFISRAITLGVTSTPLLKSGVIEEMYFKYVITASDLHQKVFDAALLNNSSRKYAYYNHEWINSLPIAILFGLTMGQSAKLLMDKKEYDKIIPILQADFLFTVTKSYDKAIALLETAIARTPNPRFFEKVSGYYFKLGEIDNSIDAMKRALEMGVDKGGSSFSRLINLMNFGEALVKRNKKPDDISNLIYLAINGYTYNPQKGIELWEKACNSAGENSADVNALYGYSLAMWDAPSEQTNRQFLKLMETIDKSQFRAVGEFRNEMMQYRGTNFMKSTFRFKRNKQARQFSQEFANASHFYRQNKDHVVHPLAYFSQDGYEYLVSKYIAELNLHDKCTSMGEAEKVILLQKATELLAWVHHEGKQLPLEDVIQSKDYTDRNGNRSSNADNSGRPIYFVNRIEDVLFHQLEEYGIKFGQAFVSEFLDTVSFINDRLAAIKERRYYKDSNPTNQVVDQKGNIVLVDFEGGKVLPPALDLVSQLEYSPEDTLSANKIKSMLHRYVLCTIGNEATDPWVARTVDATIHEREDFIGWVDLPIGNKFIEAEKNHTFAGMQRHLEMTGYKQRDLKQLGKEEYLKAMAHHRDMFVSHLRAAAQLGYLNSGETAKAKQLFVLQKGLYSAIGL